ncbi:MAG: hypothetical protein IID61_18545 [SAR324 cluster bacterium]|nr:hypothetical protein [SAR324 cluster bacterium]
MPTYDIFVVYQEYTSEHRKSGLACLLDLVSHIFPGRSCRVLILDNAVDADTELVVDGNYDFLSGDNSLHDFSAWDKGVRWLHRVYDPLPQSVFVFANDTFHRSYGSEYLELFRPIDVQPATHNNQLVGYCDAYPDEIELFGVRLRRWVRTSLFMLNYKTLTRLLPIGLHDIGEKVFSMDSDKYFNDSAPLSENYKRYLRTWLFGESFSDSSFREQWHRQSKLTEENITDFKLKTLCIISEHYFSGRAQKLRIPIYDVRKQESF